MSAALDPRVFVAFVLASVRCVSFLTVAPPFAGSVSPKIRVGLAFALALGLTNRLTGVANLPVDDFGHLLAGVLFQVGIGLAMGYLVYVLFQAVTIAGSMIDTFGGLTASQLFDPMTKTTESPSARLYQMLATLIMFATNGHLLLLAGLARSFDAAPVGGLHLDRMALLLTHNVSEMLLSALQIGAPVLGALFIADLLLGLATRAAPQLNIMSIGFGVKTLVLLMLGGVCLPLLAAIVPRLITDGLSSMWVLIR